MSKHNKLTYFFNDGKEDHPDVSFQYSSRQNRPGQTSPRQNRSTDATERPVSMNNKLNKPTANTDKEGNRTLQYGERPSYESISLPIHKNRKRTSPAWPLSNQGGTFGQGHSFQSKKTSKRPYWQAKGSTKDTVRSLSKALMITLSAIGIGILLGMMVLSSFSNLGNNQLTTINGGTNQQVVNGNGEVADDGDVGGAANVEGTGTTLSLPSQTYHVVQAGAFSDLEAAQDVEQRLTEKGWAGMVLDTEEPYRFYVGMASSREHIIAVSHPIQKEGVDVYLREHGTASVDQALVSLDEDIIEEVPLFVQLGDDLIKELTQIAADGLNNSDYELNEEQWQELQELHRQFLQSGQTVFNAWGGKEEELGEEMMRQLTTAVSTVETYKDQRHASYLWRIQQSVLNYLRVYETLLMEIQ